MGLQGKRRKRKITLFARRFGGFRVVGFTGLGFRGLGFRGLGFRVLDLGFRI